MEGEREGGRVDWRGGGREVEWRRERGGGGGGGGWRDRLNTRALED